MVPYFILSNFVSKFDFYKRAYTIALLIPLLEEKQPVTGCLLVSKGEAPCGQECSRHETGGKLPDPLRLNDSQKPWRIMDPLPPSSKLVLRILGTEGAMTHKEIVKISHCPPRTVRYALRKLKERKLLIEKMNMQDMRQIIYQYRLTPLQESRIGVPPSGESS